ncbi:MAG: hypothetical protein H6707_19890 [Deltaproteobacteria bacterium]|nr:hypothetical protein [Deltaproteobacteria bacterium]
MKCCSAYGWAAALAALVLSSLVGCQSADEPSSSDGGLTKDGAVSPGDGAIRLIDARPLSGARVLYAERVGMDYRLFRTDLNGVTAPVADFDWLNFDDSMSIANVVGHFGPVARDEPQLVSGLLASGYSLVKLADDRGYLRWYAERPDNKGNVPYGRVGVLFIGAAGQLQRLLELPVPAGAQPSSAILSTTIAISGDAQTIAAAAHGARVLVGRLAPGKFSNGKSMLQIDLGDRADVVVADSLRLVGDWLIFVSQKYYGPEVGALQSLWRVRLSGDLSTEQIPLPAVEVNTAARWVDSAIAVSENEQTAVMLVGGLGARNIVVAMDIASGKLTPLTDQLGYHGTYSGRWGTGISGPTMALSPDGKHVAYTARHGDDVWLAPTDGSAPALQLTSAQRFIEETRAARSYDLRFLDNARLIFVRGTLDRFGDLYQYDLKSQAIKNVTAVGSTTVPLKLHDDRKFVDTWLSPDRRRLFYLDEPGDLWAVGLNSGEHQRLTTGARIYTLLAPLAHCGTDGLLLTLLPDRSVANETASGVMLLHQNSAKIVDGPRLWGRGTPISQLTVTADCRHALVGVSRGQVYSGTLDAKPETVADTSMPVSNALPLVDGSGFVYVARSGSRSRLTLHQLAGNRTRALRSDLNDGGGVVLFAIHE